MWISGLSSQGFFLHDNIGLMITFLVATPDSVSSSQYFSLTSFTLLDTAPFRARILVFQHPENDLIKAVTARTKSVVLTA